MSKDYKILQIGIDNWAHYYEIPESMDWYYFCPNSPLALRKMMEMDSITNFHAILIEDGQYIRDLLPFIHHIEPYTLLYSQDFKTADSIILDFLKKRCAQSVDFSDPQRLLNDLSTSLFSGGYGDKLFPASIQIHPSFDGSISYQGFEHVILEGDFGKEFSQLAYWGFNFIVRKNSAIELWLEYEKEGDCELRFVVRKVWAGSVDDFFEEEIYSEDDLQQAIVVDNKEEDFFIMLSVDVCGHGSLKLGNLHQRWSRKQFGKFFHGGNILHDSKRDEINYFFYPGDFRPPLVVYFSGYRMAEGFEGYFMIKNLGCPFLLFSDPRLEGGAFYLGSAELEGKIKDTIQYYLDYLGLTSKDLILSGLSMGTFPSLYYGSTFEPRAIIVGKPLANIGTIAKRGRLEAPGVFRTSFDVLSHQMGGVSQEHMLELDQRFWKVFKQADFSKTTVCLSYMKDEDFDSKAYEQLINHLCNIGVKVLSKGTSGRHNDDTNTNIAWFLHFYRMVLNSNFGRGGK